MTTVLLLIDYQARLMPAIDHDAQVVSNGVMLAKAARSLGLEAWATEQNPAGLGPNVAEITSLVSQTLSKMYFDATREPGFVEALNALPGETHWVVAGCEAHVCMMQTALGLLREGFTVDVIEDASGSRRASDKSAGMRILRRAGATIKTTEMVIFEWLQTCEHPRFREVLKIIKAG